MRKSPDFTYIYGRAVKYLSNRPRSTKELHEYFVRKEFPSDVSEQVIESLTRDKFLNDEEFALWWIRGRKSQGKAEFLIRRELEKKGVSKDILEKSFDGDNFSADLEIARELVARNHRKYAKYSGYEYNTRMGAFLARRGFSWEVIREALLHKETK